MAFLAALIGAVAGVGPAVIPIRAAAAQADVPASGGLELVPADTLAFAHFRLADLWKSGLLDTLRTSFEKAGPKALAKLDELVPPPSALDRATVFAAMTDRGPQPIGIVTFTKAVDPAALAKAYLPKSEAYKVAGKAVYACAECGIAVHFPTDKQVVLAEKATLEGYLAKPVATEGGMKAALALAATRAVVVAGNVGAVPIPPQAFKDVPPEVLPLLKVQSATFSMELGGDVRLHLAANYGNAAAAADAEKALGAVKALVKVYTAKGRTELEAKLFGPADKPAPPAERYGEVLASVMGLGSMNKVDEFLDAPGIKREGNALTVSGTLPQDWLSISPVTAPILIGLLLPAVQKVREAAARSQGMNNLKQLALAMHNYLSTIGTFPAATISDKATGKPLLSWRVTVLPYLEERALYDKFKLDEPWDSEHNKKLIPLMPRVFASPRLPDGVTGALTGKTYYKVFTGKEAAFDLTAPRKIDDIADGTSNTIMLVEGGAPVEWTKPEDIPYDSAKPLPPLALAGVPQTLIALCDGSVRAIDLKAVSEKTLRAAITAAGGEVLGNDW